MRRVFAVFTAFFCMLGLASAQPAAAQVTKWRTAGSFDDGASFEGTFTYNAGTNSYTNWDLYTGFGGGNPEFTYNNSLPGHSATGDASTVNFYGGQPNQRFTMVFDMPLTSGGTRSFNDGGELGVVGYRYITGGFVASTPEPSSWAMMMGGFAIAGGALRARRRRALAVA